MRIITNLIDIDLKNEKGDHLFINSLYGCVDLVHHDEYCVIKKWIDKSEIYTNSELETKLLQKLIERKYVFEEEEEKLIKNQIIEKLKKNTEQKTLKNVFFVLTYNCNFACPYCYERDIKSIQRMTCQQVDKIFDIHNNDIENIGLFGGEPLLCSNKDIIEYIIKKAPNALYNIITNGYNLEEYFEIIKKIKINYIQVTLDGSKDIHNKTRILTNGGGTYDKIFSGIKLYSQNDVPITIRMNISKNNIHECLELKKQLQTEPWARSINFEMQPIFQSSKDDAADLKKILLDDDSSSEKRNRLYENLSPISNFIFNGKRLIPILNACDIEKRLRYYDPYGDIYSCTLAVGDKRKRIGTYEPEVEYDEVSFCKRDITTIPACKECKYSLLCGGGCANGLPADCDILKTPNCAHFINEINNTIPYIYSLKYGNNKD